MARLVDRWGHHCAETVLCILIFLQKKITFRPLKKQFTFLKIPWVGTMTYGDEMFTTVRSTVLRWHRRGGHLGTIAGGAEHGTNIHRRHIARATAPASPLSIATLVSPARPLVPSPLPPLRSPAAITHPRAAASAR